MKDRPFALIGVNSDRDLGKIREIVKKKNINWRSFQNTPVAGKGSISQSWGVSGWPTLVVLDEEMRIRHRSHNGNAAVELARKLVKKLSEKSQGPNKKL